MLNEITDISLTDFSINYGALYRSLLRSLDENNAWRTLFDTLRSTYGIFRTNDPLYKMTSSSGPAGILLHELENRFATLGHLRLFLRESNLLHSLSIISDPEPLKIIKEPGREDESFVVDDGMNLTFECIGEGLPPPSYQWYFGNIELPEETNQTLTISNFWEENRGEYFCVIRHIIGNEIISIESNHVFADLTPIAPRFVENGDLSEQYIVSVGKQLILEVSVIGRPFPEFVWLKNSYVLDSPNCDKLLFESIQPEDQDVYSCLISNVAGEIESRRCTIEVILGPEHCLPYYTASHKIALLIANKEYNNVISLKTPSNDVSLIAQQLYQLNFHVIALQNLNSIEMKSAIRWFSRNLPSQAYAFFYYAGHGFMSRRKYKYMMPVDVTESCNPTDCYADEKLIKRIMKTDIRFFVMVLDMCSEVPKRFKEKFEEEKEKTITYKKKKTISLICLYSTSNHMKAYDNVIKEYENSLYARCLAKYLTQSYPASYVATLAQAEFKKCSKGSMQIPHLVSDDCEQLSLVAEVPVYAEPTETQIEMWKWNYLKEKEQLHFERVNVKAYVYLSFHLGCFQNAIDFVFPVKLNHWIIMAEINQESLNEYNWTERDTHEKVLTVYNLQKAMSSIFITFKLFKLNRRNSQESLEMVDFCEVDLSYLEIVNKKLGLLL